MKDYLRGLWGRFEYILHHRKHKRHIAPRDVEFFTLRGHTLVLPGNQAYIGFGWDPVDCWHESWKNFFAFLRWFVTGADNDITVIVRNADGEIIDRCGTKITTCMKGRHYGLRCSKDCRTGHGEGDDENAWITFDSLREGAASVVVPLTAFFATRWDANTFCHLSTPDGNRLRCEGYFHLGPDDPNAVFTAAVPVIFYQRDDGTWFGVTEGATFCAKTWRMIEAELVGLPARAGGPYSYIENPLAGDDATHARYTNGDRTRAARLLDKKALTD